MNESISDLIIIYFHSNYILFLTKMCDNLNFKFLFYFLVKYILN